MSTTFPRRAFLLLTAAALAGASSAVLAQSASDLIEITVADTGTGQKVLSALGDGFFERHGLKVNATRLGNGGEVLAAIQGGSVQIGYADTYAAVNAISNGFDIQLVAANNQHALDIPWLVKADSPIQTAADLAGKTIGISPVPQHTVAVRGFLEANGVDPNSVKLATLRDLNSLPEALESGSVDAIYSNYTVLYNSQGGPEQFNFRPVGETSTASYADPRAMSAGFWADGTWAKANPEATQRFADALREYSAWLLEAPKAELVAHYLKYTKVDYDKISGGDPAKLDDLLRPGVLAGPVDIAATVGWYETGVRFAPKLIKAGVDLAAHILPSAKD